MELNLLMFLKHCKGLKWEAQEKWELCGTIVHLSTLVIVNYGHVSESFQSSLDDSHVFGYILNMKPVPVEINRSPTLNLMKARQVLILGLCQKMVQGHVLIKFSHQDCLYHIELESAKEEGSKSHIFLKWMEFYFESQDRLFLNAVHRFVLLCYCQISWATASHNSFERSCHD